MLTLKGLYVSVFVLCSQSHILFLYVLTIFPTIQAAMGVNSFCGDLNVSKPGDVSAFIAVKVDPTSPWRACYLCTRKSWCEFDKNASRHDGSPVSSKLMCFFLILYEVGGCLKGRDSKPNSEMWNIWSILRFLSNWEEWRCFAGPLFLQDGCIQQLGCLSGWCAMQFYLLLALPTDLRSVHKLVNLFRGRDFSLNTSFYDHGPWN